MNHGILYSTANDFKLVVSTTSDFVGNIKDRRSTYAYSFHLGTSVVGTTIKSQAIWM